MFESPQVQALLDWHVKGTPITPSERLGQPIAPDLERIIMGCLSKSPEARPPTAERLDQQLAACAPAGTWSPSEAAAWWKTHLAALETAPGGPMAEKTLVIGHRN